VFPGVGLTKSEARLLPKRRPFLGGKRGSGPLTRPSGEILTWLLLPKRVFKRQFLYVWKSFCEVGLSQLLCIDWLLAWNVVSSEAGLSRVTRLRSGHLGKYIRGPSVLYPKQSLKQSLAMQPPQCPTDAGFTMMGYPPLLLPDSISTS